MVSLWIEWMVFVLGEGDVEGVFAGFGHYIENLGSDKSGTVFWLIPNMDCF